MQWGTVKCIGCGSKITLRRPMTPACSPPEALADHLNVKPSCANDYYELGHAIKCAGKIAIRESLHLKCLEGIHLVAGVDLHGRPLHFGRFTTRLRAQDELNELKRLDPVLIPLTGWRG